MRLINKKNTSLDIPLTKYAVEHDSYEEHLYRDLYDKDRRLQSSYERMEPIYEPFKELQEDVFNILFKYSPKLTPSDFIDRTHFLNRLVIDEVLENKRYKELRSLTKLDEAIAAAGVDMLSEGIEKLVEDLLEEFEKTQENIDKVESQLEGNKLTLEEAQEILAEYEAGMRDVLKEKPSQRQLKASLEDAINEAKEVSQLITSWGLEEYGSGGKTNYQDKIKLLNKLRNSKKLKQIAQLAGRYKRLAMTAQREKIKRGTNEIYSIKLGNNVDRLLPVESVKLLIPELEDLFFKNLCEHNLLEYDYSMRERKQRGPIIICIDNSGSMSGQPEIWAKAVALGLLEIAKAQKRSLYVIHFAGQTDIAALHVNEFKKNEPFSVEEILDMAEFFQGGGTRFQTPLDLARKKITEDTKDFSKADIVLATDGNAPVGKDWLKDFLHWKKENKVNIYSVLVNIRSSSDVALKLFSDEVTTLSVIRKNVADDLAFSLFTYM